MQKSHFISLFSSNLDLFRKKNWIAFLDFVSLIRLKSFQVRLKEKSFSNPYVQSIKTCLLYISGYSSVYISRFFYMFEKGWKGFCDCSAKSTPDFPRLGKISPVVNERRGINGRRGHPPLHSFLPGPPSPATRLVKRC